MNHLEKMYNEGIEALQRVEVLLNHIPSQQDDTDMMAIIGQTLCRDGMAQLTKVWEKGGDSMEQDTRLKLLKLTQEIPEGQLESAIRFITGMIGNPEETPQPGG